MSDDTAEYRLVKPLFGAEATSFEQHSVGFFEAMRRAHPMKIGDCIEGKRIVMTFWEWSPEHGNVPMYCLDGDTAARIAS